MKLKEYAKEAVGLLAIGHEEKCQAALRRGAAALDATAPDDAACLRDALQLLRAGVTVDAWKYLRELSK